MRNSVISVEILLTESFIDDPPLGLSSYINPLSHVRSNHVVAATIPAATAARLAAVPAQSEMFNLTPLYKNNLCYISQGGFPSQITRYAYRNYII